MKIFEIAQQIHQFSPISIYIDGIEVWTDNIDLTTVKNEEEERRLIKELREKYCSTILRTDSINYISFRVVEDHHTIVSIQTTGENE